LAPRSAGWWLVMVLIYCEKKILLAGWLVAGLIWRERKALLLAGWSCEPNKAWITKD